MLQAEPLFAQLMLSVRLWVERNIFTAEKVLPHAEKKSEFMESALEISQVTTPSFSQAIPKELRSDTWLILDRSLPKVQCAQPNGSVSKNLEFILWMMCSVYKTT